VHGKGAEIGKIGKRFSSMAAFVCGTENADPISMELLECRYVSQRFMEVSTTVSQAVSVEMVMAAFHKRPQVYEGPCASERTAPPGRSRNCTVSDFGPTGAVP
jgi:hypothetical protein